MPAVTRRELTRLIGKWREIIGIAGQWRIGVRVHEKRPPDADDDDAHARIEVQPQYFSATIDIYDWNCVDVDMDEVICHELLHIVLKPNETIVHAAFGKRLAESAEQHCEGMADFLTRALVRLDRRKPRCISGGRKR
jgi:hypothetical protein